jgi:hypothetical protein
MSEGFYFSNSDALMPFWRTVRRYKIECREGRTELLRKFVARKEAKYVPNPEKLMKNKKIVYFRRKNEN